MPEVEIDVLHCTGCGRCVDFCPVEVFDLVENGNHGRIPVAVRQERCWACDTCVGQCPSGAVKVKETEAEWKARSIRRGPPAEPVPVEEQRRYFEWHEKLSTTLALRSAPVAVSLIPHGAPVPDVPVPSIKLRHCQSIMATRGGDSFLLPPQSHACPDGAHALGLTELPPRLVSGELYVQFGKMASVEAARRMVEERPHLRARSIAASLVTPLKDAIYPPDVIVVMANPEQIMWLCMSASFCTGQRFDFKVNGYNALCVETIVIPFMTGNINISLGCYGCRGSSDIDDDLMFIGIPRSEMSGIIHGLERLREKAIPDAREKIYLIRSA
jgi:uncharacterized protein (DUF169 family)/NAD-dependent dihydropyrimidine dehydrogenase PreA subunit